jgi:hypothetical protein
MGVLDAVEEESNWVRRLGLVMQSRIMLWPAFEFTTSIHEIQVYKYVYNALV